jgi:hypothetical protein
MASKAADMASGCRLLELDVEAALCSCRLTSLSRRRSLLGMAVFR